MITLTGMSMQATTHFFAKGGSNAPPLLFKGGAFLAEGGALFFSNFRGLNLIDNIVLLY